MDMDIWREYWRRTQVQGLIVNTGGIVAYYASSLDLQYRAQGLGDQYFLGEFISLARQEGLTVLARMDINRATKQFYEDHPDWFVVNVDGEPHTSNDRYFSCVNSDYYKKFIPQVLGEIIRLYQPDGFTDNSWTGVSRHMICHCEKDVFQKFLIIARMGGDEFIVIISQENEKSVDHVIVEQEIISRMMQRLSSLEFRYIHKIESNNIRWLLYCFFDIVLNIHHINGEVSLWMPLSLLI